jgi:8-hydroxy-5-deazaflavin:NADPH oxidoreductase
VSVSRLSQGPGAVHGGSKHGVGSRLTAFALNPLDTSKGLPPSLTVCNTDSLGEQVQREFPDTRVVKALNTVNCDIMVDPARVPGDHNLFICGNEAVAKREVINRLCEWFGWKPSKIIDLGDITHSRGTEMFLALWVRLWGVLGTPHSGSRAGPPGMASAVPWPDRAGARRA